MPDMPGLYCDRPRDAVLGRRHIDAREGGINAVKQVSNSVTERLRADGNSESDKDDEHRIFGGRGTALVAAKSVDQTEH